VPTPALAALEVALGDVENLIAHHPKSANPGRGRPTTDEGPLLRSCVVLLYAAWEVYIEDSVIWAVGQVTATGETADLPDALRSFVADRTVTDPWRLAGDGWRQVCVDEVTTLARGNAAGSFGINTAGPKQIAVLHNQILGVNLLDRCRWNKKPTKAIKSDLALLISVRGEIAHTGQTPGALHLAGVRSWQNFIQRLARKLDGHLEAWVDEHSPSAPST
jgi:hypothetical protein